MFVDYLEKLNESIRTPINRNWTSFKQTLPVSLKSFQLDSKLLHAPVMLRDFINQYQENRITATKWGKKLNIKISILHEQFLNRHVSVHSSYINSNHSICDNLHHHRAVKTKGISGY